MHGPQRGWVHFLWFGRLRAGVTLFGSQNKELPLKAKNFLYCWVTFIILASSMVLGTPNRLKKISDKGRKE